MANSVTIVAPATGEYGYVEPNFLSAPRTGQVRGDLPAASDITELTNGQFVVRDTVNGEVKLAGSSSTNVWMVFNEEKLYDERYQAHKYFAQKAADYTDGVMVPRIIKLIVGDTYTTNNVKAAEYTEGNYLQIGTDGILEKASSATALQIVKATTMPDGLTAAVKIEVVSTL